MPGNEAPLEQLAHGLGIESVPDSWKTQWPAFESWKSGGKCDGLRWELPANAVEVFDLPIDSLDDLRGVYQAIRENDFLAELADFWHFVIYHLPEGAERRTEVWGVPDQLVGHSTKLLSLAVMASGADHASENFAKTGVSEEVIRATLGYIGRYARDIRQKRGVWGLESVGWLRLYVRARIFRLGRLTFKSGRFDLPFRAFMNRRTGEVVTLCEPSVRYRTDGLADGTNGVFDPEAWTPILEIGEDAVTGHPVSRECTAVREPTTLATGEWRQVLAQGEDAVEVHIAGGSKLVPEECADSYRQAVQFYPKYYPEARFVAFRCWSWLLDPSLAKILPRESNIVQFQRAFHIVPVASNESQAYDLVFGDSGADPTKITPTTSLQRAIADYVSAGNRLRSAAGFILWDEAVELGGG